MTETTAMKTAKSASKSDLFTEEKPAKINLSKLSEPIKSVKWRVQSAKNGRAVCVPYVDARDVMDRLDEVCGMENWQDRHREEKGHIYCEVGIKVNGNWIWKSDVGSESNIEGSKGESSDSFKRACVKWGVGRFLYSIPPVVLPTTQYKAKEYPLANGKDYKGKTFPLCKGKTFNEAVFNGDALSRYINKFIYPSIVTQ